MQGNSQEYPKTGHLFSCSCFYFGYWHSNWSIKLCQTPFTETCGYWMLQASVNDI